jgi:hypothetical protein
MEANPEAHSRKSASPGATGIRSDREFRQGSSDHLLNSGTVREPERGASLRESLVVVSPMGTREAMLRAGVWL